VVANIERKERQAADMMRQLVEHMGHHYEKVRYSADDLRGNNVTLPAWLNTRREIA